MQIFANTILPVGVFNLSITPGDEIEKTNERMATKYQGTWHRRLMPRTVLVFINDDPAKAAEEASEALRNYWRALEGTLDEEKVRRATNNALVGDAKAIAKQMRERFHPEVKHYFREGTRTRVIDLPGDKRIIRNINLRYRNLPGGGRARVEVWGWKAGEAHGGGGGGGGWDSHGWQMLGERTVAHRVDHDTIEVGAYKGRFAKLTMYVLDNELELFDMDIKFGNGEHFHPEAKYFFKEGSRTRIIDLPGDERVIKRIDLRYKSIPGEGKAKVQVWAK